MLNKNKFCSHDNIYVIQGMEFQEKKNQGHQKERYIYEINELSKLFCQLNICFYKILKKSVFKFLKYKILCSIKSMYNFAYQSVYLYPINVMRKMAKPIKP